MVAWYVELSEFNLQYEPHGPMKTQFMVDFLVEFAENDQTTPNWWNLYVDDASNMKESRAGIIIKDPGNITLEQALKLHFKASNNQAEYEALILDLTLPKDVGAKPVLQKKKKMGKEQRKTAREEVDKLIKANFI